MRKVGAREANQHFSELLREAEAGTEVLITRNGRPVARLLPTRKSTKSKARQKALAELMALLEKGVDLGGRRFSRSDMHD